MKNKKTKNNIIICLDFDGVILNAPEIKVRIASEMLGRPIPIAELSGDQITAGKSTVTIEQYREIQLRTYTSEATATASAVTGSIDAIKEWLRAGHEVRIVTARVDDILEDARRWLAGHDIAVPMVGVGHRASKLRHLADADYFVDDDPIHVREASAVVPHAFLFKWPYNDASGGIQSITSLRNIVVDST